MTNPSDMPGWPDIATFNNLELDGYAHGYDAVGYERARADAAMARLRVAVEALESLGQSLGCKYGDSVISVGTLLSTIGPLPPLPPQQQRTEK